MVRGEYVSRHSEFRCRGRWLVVLGTLLISGCSASNENTVTGIVAIDGKPAERGSITFFPVDGQSRTTGTKIEGGKYTANVPAGMQRIEIHVPKVVGRKKLYNAPDSPLEDITDESLPAKYNTQSELQLEVKPGANQKDFELTTK